ncbi:MAG: phage tail assembly chaperone [Acidovorax sp.]|nr:phage tail assembly chaperone [Acidovorax sp.]
MIDFFVTLPNGQIVMVGYCPKGQLKLQQHPGGVVRVGKAQVGVHYWDSAMGVVPLPPRPSPDHAFDYGSKEWSISADRAWTAVRAQRDARLAACDWVALRAHERGEPVPAEWLAYRQALRDITRQADPLAVDWPVVPG